MNCRHVRFHVPGSAKPIAHWAHQARRGLPFRSFAFFKVSLFHKLLALVAEYAKETMDSQAFFGGIAAMASVAEELENKNSHKFFEVPNCNDIVTY